MKIAVVGAAGRMGKLLVTEALQRGHKVTAIVRDIYMVPDPSVRVLECDVHDLTYDDLFDQEVIIDAFGVWDKELVGQHISSLMHLADLLEGQDNRLLVVGGAGSLFIDPDCTTRIIDLPDFPKGAYPVVKSMCDAFLMLKERASVNWTYMSPAPDFQAEGDRTGVYRLGGDLVPRNMRGKSEISYPDFAIAMLDEAERAEHVRQRISVYSV